MMRAISIGWIWLAACGGPAGTPATAVTPATTAHPTTPRTKADPDRPPIDPIAALTPDDAGERSWVVPGPIRIELGGTPISAAGSGRPIEVAPIDRQGNLERVAVRLDHARFSVWIDHANLLSVLTHDRRLDPLGPPVTEGNRSIAGRGPRDSLARGNPCGVIGSDIEVVLRAGAVVRRLAHREHSTLIRYLGALQVEGWVPDAVLGDRARAHDGSGRIPTGRQPLMVLPGAVIRTEPRWAAPELALVAYGYLLDTIRDVDAAWSEVSYQDGDVAVHGFVSRRDPPGRVHRWKETDATPTITPSATVASGTCLFARPGGDAVGYIVGNRPVDLDDGSATGVRTPGWWVLTIDTPWGPLAFAAQGPARTELAACAPPNIVPPPAPPAPVPAPPSP
jgi:hypothetical protein